MKASFRSTFFVLCAAGGLLGASATWAASPSSAQSIYQVDRAACMSGHTQESRATCLKEAGAAEQARRRDRLALPNQNYEQNALARCKLQPEGLARAACDARIKDTGNTTVSGSVAGGGLLFETVTPVPAK